MTEADARTFIVHACADGRGAGHRIQGGSFEEAAVAFVEIWRPAVSIDGDIKVIVRDAEDGREHCFLVDVFEGEVAPCG